MIQHHIEITYIMWYSTNWLDVGGVYTRGIYEKRKTLVLCQDLVQIKMRGSAS